jgi:hypothetical protein
MAPRELGIPIRWSAAMSSNAIVRQIPTGCPDPRLVQGLFGLLFLGVVAMLSFPSARGASAWLGSMPLWLLGMPLAALAALHVRKLVQAPAPAAMPASRRRRAGANPQARRRGPATASTRMPRAA